MRSLLWLFFTLCLPLGSCKTNAGSFTEQNDSVSFGSFGGFAGSYSEFLLFENGSVFKRSKLNGPIVEMAPITLSQAKQSFEVLKSIIKDHKPISDPGNMSYFIRYNQKGKENIEFIWGGRSIKYPDRLILLYKNLVSLCGENHPVM